MERTTDRAGLLIVHAQHLLVIYRWKNGREYYVLPGGSVEAGETPTQAALREAWEETSLTLTAVSLMQRIERQHHTEYYFLAAAANRHVQLQGPEQERQSPNNVYRLVWVQLFELEHLPLQPEDIRPLCRTVLHAYTDKM